MSPLLRLPMASLTWWRKHWFTMGIVFAAVAYVLSFGVFLKVYRGTQGIVAGPGAAPVVRERWVFFSQRNGERNAIGKRVYWPLVCAGEAFGWWRFIDSTHPDYPAESGPCLLIYVFGVLDEHRMAF